MTDIDERRYTVVKVIPNGTESATVAYGNYRRDKRWHIFYDNQSKSFDNFSQLFEYCNVRFKKPFGGVL